MSWNCACGKIVPEGGACVDHDHFVTRRVVPAVDPTPLLPMEYINTMLHAARLEGARLMQERCEEECCRNCSPECETTLSSLKPEEVVKP